MPKTKERKREISEIQAVLKDLMARSDYGLKDLAKHLSVSIATAKRLLNQDDLSMERVIEICDWLGIEFYQVMEHAKLKRAEFFYCTEEQETFLSLNLGHFAFLRALQKDCSLTSIRERHSLSDRDIEIYLRDLDREGFLERGESQQFKLLVPDGMDWRVNGPLWEKLMPKWVESVSEHFCEPIENEEGTFLFDLSQRKFTKETIQQLVLEIDDLSRRYASISRVERLSRKREKLYEFTCFFGGDTWMAPMWRIPKITS